MTEEQRVAVAEMTAKQRKRLQPILEQLDAGGESTFLDLCELVLMLAERVEGSLRWTHPRAIVHIKPQRKKKKGI